MRCVLELKSDSKICLPISYNHIVQSWIYHSISEIMASFLHDQGFMVENKTFRLFCFSRLMGNYTIDSVRKEIIYDGTVYLIITSPLPFFIEELTNGILSTPYIRLGRNALTVEGIYNEINEIQEDEITLRVLSPITVYSTMTKMDGKKYTVYFMPKEPDYDEMITKNLLNKYQAIYDDPLELKRERVHVEPLRRGRCIVANYKNFIIKGYSGLIHVTGPAALLQVAVDCGLGSKNSQGFGCVELMQ
jgi:CRISPR-associated endoribonuclease Cas6